MKTFLLICALVAFAYCHQFTKKTPAEIKSARQECWNEFNLSTELRESMTKYEYPDDTAVHKAIKCTGIKLGVWCEDEGYHKADLISQFGEGATTLLEKCISKKKDTDTAEKWAWHDWTCFTQNGLKDHFKNIEQ